MQTYLSVSLSTLKTLNHAVLVHVGATILPQVPKKEAGNARY